MSSMKKRVEELEKQLSKRRSDSQEIVELQLKLIIKQAEMGEPLGVNLNEPSSGIQRPNADLVEREEAAKQVIGHMRLEIERLLKERDRLLGSETLKEKKAGGNLLGDLLKGGDLLGGVLNIDEGSKANSGGINERSPQLKK